MAGMRLIVFVCMIPALPGFAQRVVDPGAPWKKEKQGVKMSGALLDATSDLAPPIHAGEFVRRQGSVLTIGFNCRRPWLLQASWTSNLR